MRKRGGRKREEERKRQRERGRGGREGSREGEKCLGRELPPIFHPETA